MGMLRRNERMTGKKSPNKLRKPKSSMQTPTMGHLMKTSAIPPRKQIVPLSLFFRAKK